VLCGTVFAAHADTDFWTDITKQHRHGDTELLADKAYCNQIYGKMPEFFTPSLQHRQCMRSLGWRYSHTVRDNKWEIVTDVTANTRRATAPRVRTKRGDHANVVSRRRLR
jgi:hypothetical protein